MCGGGAWRPQLQETGALPKQVIVCDSSKGGRKRADLGDKAACIVWFCGRTRLVMLKDASRSCSFVVEGRWKC